MDNLTIRPATAGDLDVLLKFEQQIIEAERPFDPTIREGDNVHYYDLAALVALPNAHVVVAEVESKIVASGYARIDASEPYLKHQTHAYLGFMYVVPEYRGKGINRMIVRVLEDWSRSQGVMEMRLEVYDMNAAAIRAYEKCGFAKLVVLMRRDLVDEQPGS
jgi:GNAT superfamily N-acetyltransferase